MDDAFALLRLQAEWGADEAINPDPIDRLRPVEAAPPPVRLAAPAAAAPAGMPVDRATDLAAQAATLDELRAALAGFEGCALRDTAGNLVFAEGDPASTTLLIGEPPGRDEDRGGHPFAGAEGQLLDQMLASIGLARSALMLTPLLPWRPPGGRPPSPGEIAMCLPFLHRLIVLLAPRRVVLFGASPVRVLLPRTVNRRRSAPDWVYFSIPDMQKTLPCLALPSMLELLKTPLSRRDAWVGLRLLRRALDTEPTEK